MKSLDKDVVVGSGVRQDIIEVINRHGLTIDDLVRCGKGGLQASKDIKDRDGEVVDTVPDWNVRHKFFSSFMELLGYLKGSGTTVNVGVSAEEKEVEEMFKAWRQNKG